MSSPSVTIAAAAKSASYIDWASLGKVAGVSFIFGIAIVVLFSVGIVALSWMGGEGTESDGQVSLAGINLSAGADAATGNRVLGAGLATVCFSLCAGAALYGLYLIIPQFHR